MLRRERAAQRRPLQQHDRLRVDDVATGAARLGVEAVDACLRRPAQAPRALARFDRLSRRGAREFSWFIYRVTNPTMQTLFMAPRNYLRMQEALLSLLAGDVYGKSPIRASLLAFKALFYFMSLANLARTIRAWRRRRANIRDADAASAGA